MANEGQRPNRSGRPGPNGGSAVGVPADDDVPSPEGAGPPVPSTVVTRKPGVAAALPVRAGAPARPPTPGPSRARPVAPPPDLAEEEPPAADPRATRILTTESIEGPPPFELVVTEGPARGARFPLRGGVMVVGRSARCDCSILDEAISRRHFELSNEGGRVTLRDLGSGNGTLVNGKRADEIGLQGGDEIRIGDSTLEFRERGKKNAPRPHADAPGKKPGQAAPAVPSAGGKRGLLIGVLAIFAALLVILALARTRKHQQLVQAAVARFEQGRAELHKGNADDALQDFEVALPYYPDREVLQEQIALAHALADGNRALTHARDLLDQKDFVGARKVLDDIPHNDLLDAPVKKVRAEVDRQQAALQQAQQQKALEYGQPIDPTTMAEAKEYWDKAKKEERDHVDAAQDDIEHAFEMLSSRGAGGPDFEQLKKDYVEVLKLVYERYRRSNRAKAELAAEKANVIEPNAIAVEGEGANPAKTPPPSRSAAPERRHPSRRHAMSAPTRRHAPPVRRQAVASTRPAAHHYDESRADDLVDEGDAMLGQNPDAARAKYQEALKYAPPGSDAAQRARAGLGN